MFIRFYVWNVRDVLVSLVKNIWVFQSAGLGVSGVSGAWGLLALSGVGVSVSAVAVTDQLRLLAGAAGLLDGRCLYIWKQAEQKIFGSGAQSDSLYIQPLLPWGRLAEEQLPLPPDVDPLASRLIQLPSLERLIGSDVQMGSLIASIPELELGRSTVPVAINGLPGSVGCSGKLQVVQLINWSNESTLLTVQSYHDNAEAQAGLVVQLGNTQCRRCVARHQEASTNQAVEESF